MLRTTPLVALALLVPLPKTQATTTQKRHPHDRVVTIGASLTYGTANKLPLAKLVEGGLRKPGTKVVDKSDQLFFLNASARGKRQIGAARKLDPTLVVAVDFPFWFGYGDIRTKKEIESKATPSPETAQERRLKRLAIGLKLLDSIECPLVIGDLPDVRDTYMIPKHAIPSRRALRALNERVRAWTDARKSRVRLLPIAGLVAKMRQGKLTLPRSRKASGSRFSTAQMLSADKLHPTKAGMVVLAAHLSKTLASFGKKFAIDFDAPKLVDKHLASAGPTK